MNGQRLQRGHGVGEPVLFTARLTRDGLPLPGHAVWVHYQRPMGMMGAHAGTFRLYDDGTHGDPIAGDGVYCLLDVEERFGCNAAGMKGGEYTYDYWGQHHDGQESNHLRVNVWLEDD